MYSAALVGPLTSPPHSLQEPLPFPCPWRPASPWERGHLPSSQLTAELDGQGSSASPESWLLALPAQ